MIENDYEEEVYETEEEVDEMYRGEIEGADQIDKAGFDGIEDEETSIIEKRRKKKSKCEPSRNSGMFIINN